MQRISNIYLHAFYELTLARIELPGLSKRATEIALSGTVAPRKAEVHAELIGLKVVCEKVMQRLEVAAIKPGQDILSEYLKAHNTTVAGHAALYAQEHGVFTFTSVTVYGSPLAFS